MKIRQYIKLLQKFAKDNPNAKVDTIWADNKARYCNEIVYWDNLNMQYERFCVDTDLQDALNRVKAKKSKKARIGKNSE